MKRKYEKESKKKLAYSSWYMRFTPELGEFLKLCVTHVIEQFALEQNKVLNEKLTKFKDVLIQDSTIIRLHESLAKKWPAARSRTVAAGVKVGVLVSAVANSPKSIGIYAERTNELKTLRIGPWIKDRILLIDLGFYKHVLFSKIKQHGGSFISRLKGNVNPLIIDAYNTCPGNSIDVKGKYLNEILPKLKGEVLDVEVEISFKRPNYNGNTKKPHIIEAYIWISILTLFISRRIYNIVRKHSPKEKMVRYTQLRWSTIFTENADAQALDPHVNRHRFREEWWA